MADDSTVQSDPSRPGQRRGGSKIRLKDIAEQVKLHPSTVSRVLSGDPAVRVSTKKAELVKTVAARLGYVPDASATALKTRFSRMIGVIVHDIADPVYARILSGLEEGLAQQGYMAIIGHTGYDQDAEAQMFRKLTARMVDGIVLGTTRLADPLLDQADHMRVPTVSMLRHPDQPGRTAVIDDCFWGMRQLARAVADAGHRDIGVIAAPQHLSTAQDRLNGLRHGLRDHGIQISPNRLVYVSQMTCQNGRKAARALLQARPVPPSIIMAVNDRVALGALRELRDMGLSCPQDVALTGYNESHPLDLIDPPLTSVAIDQHAIGQIAAKEILGLVQNPEAQNGIIRLKPKLCLRRSHLLPGAAEVRS